MSLSDYIYKRKSTRKYDLTPVDSDTMTKICDFADNLVPLYKDIKVNYRIANGDSNEVRNLLPIKAPHYIIIYSEKKEGYLTNVGFMFQQMDLFLSSINLGSCWLGMAKPTKKLETENDFVIIIGFGKALDSPHRNFDDFSRKSLNEITNVNDTCLEPARLAPSATNSQPWFFLKAGTRYDVFCVKHRLVKSLMYEKMNKIDIGIALACLFVSAENSFSFFIVDELKRKDDYENDSFNDFRVKFENGLYMGSFTL